MATNYYKEGVERITEQMLEQDILNDIADIEDKYLNHSTSEKADMIKQLGESGIRKDLNAIYADTDKIYQDTVAIAQNTEDIIENDIATMIVNKGYKVNFFNDGNGNVTAILYS